MRGHDSELLQLHEGGDPFLRPSAFLFRVDALERGKGQLVRIPDIVVIAARAEAEWKQAHTFVKSEDAGVFVTTELRRDEGQQGGLARAGRPEDKRMAEITGVYVEPERRGIVRHQHGQRPGIRRIERARVYRRARPDRRQRQQIRQIQGIDHRAAQVCVAVARMCAEPGFQGVYRLDPAAEAECLHRAP